MGKLFVIQVRAVSEISCVFICTDLVRILLKYSVTLMLHNDARITEACCCL